MRRITQPMFRYGEADWDADYMRWGFHDRDTQVREAESVLRLLRSSRSLRILDMACGTGVHAVHWARSGHNVTAVDLSETFITEGRRLAEAEGVEVAFEVGDIRLLPYRRRFDVVTWVEISFFDEEMVRAAHGYLKPGGAFIFDARNPENPRVKGRSGDWSAWREENGVFHLESHETDLANGVRRDSWIEIDTVNDLITERPAVWEPVRLREKLEMLRRNGFTRVELRTLDGESFCHGEEPYWLWAVGRRSWLRPAAVFAESRGESLPRV